MSEFCEVCECDPCDCHGQTEEEIVMAYEYIWAGLRKEPVSTSEEFAEVVTRSQHTHALQLA